MVNSCVKLTEGPIHIHVFVGSILIINGNSRILKWRYVSTIFLAIFCGDIPLHRPYIGLIYGRYLQFRILKFPLNQGIVFYASPPAPASFRKSNFRRWPPVGPERCVILDPSGRWAAMCQLLSKKICTSRKCASIPKDAEDGFHIPNAPCIVYLVYLPTKLGDLWGKCW